MTASETSEAQMRKAAFIGCSFRRLAGGAGYAISHAVRRSEILVPAPGLATLRAHIRDELPTVAIGLEAHDVSNRRDRIVGDPLLHHGDRRRATAFGGSLRQSRRLRCAGIGRADGRKRELRGR